MGVGKGACSEWTYQDFTIRFPNRCWKPFPRKSDLPLVPSVVAKLNVCDLNEDLNIVNQGSPLTAFHCSFSPDSDCLFSLVSVFRCHLFLQDGLNHINLTSNVPTAGFVTIWSASSKKEDTDGTNEGALAALTSHDYDFDSCSPTMFTYSPQPVCSFNSNGEAITVILNSGKDALTIAKREEDDMDHSPIPSATRNDLDYDNSDADEAESDEGEKDSLDDIDDDVWFSNYSLYPNSRGRATLCGRVQCAVYSPCGTKLVTVNKVSLSTYRNKDIHELCLWDILPAAKLKCLWSASCEVICPEFNGSITSCRFSLDSRIIAVSSNHGFCMLVNSRSGELYSLLSPIENHGSLHSPCDFDFDPSRLNLIALVWRYGLVKLFKLQKTSISSLHSYSGREEQPFSNCIKYSLDGMMIAVGTMTGQVHLLDAKTGIFMQCLDVGLDIVELVDRTVFGICFAKSCQELIAAYNDGIVRIWQLQRILNLQHICRLAILKSTVMNEIDKLPVPTHMKSYLLYDEL